MAESSLVDIRTLFFCQNARFIISAGHEMLILMWVYILSFNLCLMINVCELDLALKIPFQGQVLKYLIIYIAYYPQPNDSC